MTLTSSHPAPPQSPPPQSRPGSRRPGPRRTVVGILLLTLSAGLAYAALDARSVATERSASLTPSMPTVAAVSGATDDPGRPVGVAALRARAQAVPSDPTAWTSLGFAVLESARASGDPAQYGEAAEAFAHSLRLLPDNNTLALAGQAALADAQHQFADGERLARRALLIEAGNPVALAALTDALTEQGRYPQALDAATALDAARPGVSSFTRLSYQAELRGQTAEALALLRRTADVADTPSEVAFARAQEGLLALSTGDRDAARRALTQGRAVAPDDTSLLHLSARLAWADQDGEAARTKYATLVARRPAPAWAGEQAEVLAALGDTRGANRALEVARASYTLSATTGVQPEGTQVLFEADHGSPAEAVRLGAALVARAPSTANLDAYAWALHRVGRDAQALPIAKQALTLGGRAPLALFHRGAIQAALGHRTEAATDLRAALALEPRFSALHAPEAARLLSTLERTVR